MTTPAEIDEQVAALYRGGATMQDIGDLIGVSRERVRQRLERVGLHRRGEFSRDDPLRVIHALRTPGVATWTDVARVSGAAVNKVKRVVTTLGMLPVVLRLLRARQHTQQQQRRTEMIRLLQLEAVRLGRTPSATDVNRADSGTPSASLYVIEFGSITNAQLAAGLRPNRTGGGKGRITTYTVNGESLTLYEWSQRTGIHVGTLSHRIKAGWDVTEAITTPTPTMRRPRGRCSACGQRLPISEATP